MILDGGPDLGSGPLAERAKRLLPENSAKWLRADDIVASLRPLEGEGR